MPDPSRNAYLDGRLSVTFAKTALPIIFVMSMNGLLTVADALFLGHYVGRQALAAVTLAFPPYMMIVAFATLVGSGMSSLLARHLGGRRIEQARIVYASAHWLALAASAVLAGLYVTVGARAMSLAAGGDAALAAQAETYIRILVFFSPLLFLLSVNSDALRNEGHVGFMAATGLLVSLGNIAFNYLLIAVLHFGVAGSAYGTVSAQALALAIVLAFRLRGRTTLRPAAVFRHFTTSGWGGILALGAPQSLGFIGVALLSSAILAALRIAGSPDYAVAVSAYGIVTRVMTFAILPVLGLSQAMQTITGNNHGAGEWRRADGSLRFALGAALLFCSSVQAFLTVFATRVGSAFVDDPQVVAKVGAILPVMLGLFLLSGPLAMVSAHFQAVGDAVRAAILGLSKIYLFAIPLTFVLALAVGEEGIWWAGPVAEAMLLVLTVLVLSGNSRRQSLRRGLFATQREARS